jgi:GntR family transcriptional regulator, transcriptional repressor for pyruvate dehydrogenase complex
MSAGSRDGRRLAPEKAEIFRPILASRAALEVADQLTYAVISGQYAVGDWLPKVGELAERMRCSKPTIGEALRLLADAGVLEPRRGSGGGTIVKSAIVPPEVMKLAQRRRGRTLAELIEARAPIEMELARLAAGRATDVDLDRLAEINTKVIASVTAGPEWAHANNLFHYAIARAADNHVLAGFQHDILEEMLLLTDGYAEGSGDREDVIAEHEKIHAALCTRDAAAAATAMCNHVERAGRRAVRVERTPNGRS